MEERLVFDFDGDHHLFKKVKNCSLPIIFNEFLIFFTTLIVKRVPKIVAARIECGVRVAQGVDEGCFLAFEGLAESQLGGE